MTLATLPWTWEGDPDDWVQSPNEFAGSGISTGARLYAIDRDALTIRWQRDLYGVGPVGHSEYFNMLQIGTAAGHVVVCGNEAYGRYLEVVDPVSGASVVNKVWTGRA